MNESSHPQKYSIDIPFRTVVTLLLAILFVKFSETVTPIILPVLISVLLAVSLNSAVNWMQKRGVKRPWAIAVMILSLALFIGIFLVSVVPSVYHEGSAFLRNLSQFKDDLLQKLDPDNPVRGFIKHSMNADMITAKPDQVKEILGAGNRVLGAFAELFLVFVLAVYLLIDGPSLIDWLKAFFTNQNQNKIDETADEVSKIISAYIFGQFLTSLLSFLFVLVCLELLKVPNAPLLATLAGLLDILPVLGFVLAVIPAMLFAAKVSAETSWIVLSLYFLYHVLENYFIVPFVYGNRMRVSGFVVFLSLLVFGLIGGIEGAIVALPIVASYPIIERIWLKKLVRPAAIAEHTQQ